MYRGRLKTASSWLGKLIATLSGVFSLVRLLGGVLLLLVLSEMNHYVSMDIGYQNQSINTPGPRVADVMNHILLIQWFIDWTD